MLQTHCGGIWKEHSAFTGSNVQSLKTKCGTKRAFFTGGDDKREEKTTEASNLCLYLNSTSLQITFRDRKRGN